MDTNTEIMKEMAELINFILIQDIDILSRLAHGTPVPADELENLLRDRIESKVRNRKILDMIEEL